MASILKAESVGLADTTDASASTTGTGAGRVIKQVVSDAVENTTSTGEDNATQNTNTDELPASSRSRAGVVGRVPADVIGRKPGGLSGLADFNLDDIAEQGHEQLQRCHRQISEMLDNARKQAKKLELEADSRGYAEGTQRASQEIDRKITQLAEQKTAAQLQSLRDAVSKMHSQYDQWMHQYAELLTTTAIAAAECLTRANLATLPSPPSLNSLGQIDSVGDPTKEHDPTGNEQPENQEQLLVRWAREALHSTRSAGRLTLAVHPDTLAELGKQLDELLAHPDLPEQSTVIPDETLSVGDVVVRQDGGEIRAGLQAQLERLREELT